MSDEAWDPAGIHYLLGARRALAAMEAAAAVDLFEVVADGASDVASVAEGCGIDANIADRLLRTFVALGVMSERRGHHSLNAPPGMLRLLGRPCAIATRVTRGTPPLRLDRPAHAEAMYAGQAVRGLSLIMQSPARIVGQRLARPGALVVDVGAGGASWSLAMVRTEPSTRVIAVDLPRVLETTREVVADEGLTSAYQWCPGDIFELEPPTNDADVVVLGLVCHLFDRARVHELLQWAGRCLKPGGQLVIVDVVRFEGAKDSALELYDLDLSSRTAFGHVWDERELLAIMADAGFGPVQHSEPLGGEPPLHLLVAAARPVRARALHGVDEPPPPPCPPPG